MKFEIFFFGIKVQAKYLSIFHCYHSDKINTENNKHHKNTT